MAEARRQSGPAYLGLMQRIRVPLGFLLAPLLLIVAHPNRASMALGAGVAVLGLALRAWASGHLRKNDELTISGPYAHTRNPLYLGTLVLGIGISICSGALWFVALFGIAYLLVYVPVMIAEARTMQALFPDEYDRYSSRVSMFLPWALGGAGVEGGPVSGSGNKPSRRGFDSSLYLKHREYRAAAGTLAVLLLLLIKEYF
jgi:protein-S-isoprenylcysteine O-methyltransferase Ste14